jgi:hypothetical protein
MEALNAKYGQLMATYENHVHQALESGDIHPHIGALKTLNQQISSVLDEMIALTAKAKESHATVYRDDLMQKLDRIQRDYNGLALNTDQLETLRRIRRDQAGVANQFFSTYFWLFIALCFFILFFLFMKKAPVQSKVSVMSTPTVATTTPILT